MMAEDTVRSLLRARTRLLLDYPMFGQVILFLESKEVSWCKTAATDGRFLFVNSDFVRSLNQDELVFLCGHEVLHVVFDHIFRRGGRDKDIWNMACLAWGTEILMADGSSQPIQRIVPGDLIASPCGPSKVLGNVMSGIKPTMEYNVGNYRIRSTLDHKYASKEGFFDAETIIETTGDGYILNDAGRQGLCSSELSNNVIDGAIKSDWGFLRMHKPIAESERLESESLFAYAIQYSQFCGNASERNGIHGWNRGRRRDNNNTKNTWEPSRPRSDCIKHVVAIEGVAGGTRFFINHSDEQSWATLFPVGDQRMGRCGYPAEFVALSRDQETARSVLTSHYGDTEEYALAMAGARGRSITHCGNQGIERARFSVREGSGAFAPIFDLITEAGVFFANGVMTHNCDFLANHLLVKEKIGKMPKNGLYDARYSSDVLTVEDLYAMLERNKTPIRQPLDQHLDAAGDGSDDTPTYTEAERQSMRDTISAALIQGVQQQEAKEAGSTPLGISRLVDQFLRPRIDWRAMLDHGLRSTIKYDYSYARMARRYWSSGLVLPGPDVTERVEAVACLDGSVSTTIEMITDFLTECYGIITTFRDFRLLVMTFDTEVYNIQEFTPDNADDILHYEFHGGGGTTPSCCWRYLQDNDIVPHKLLLFTDGEVGNDFGEEGYCDTLFIIHSNPRITAPYGVTTHYEPRPRTSG